ncbi:glycosyltransferase family 2 protein [Rariglobus hedericola]|uniref:Galactosyltransferase C-terminal domain-containing protein n=1 Tax=Rariglobus hedericola TaxID=2597822 RepID=A0A556QPK5_9BACT|nr:galactosyltransferase-related protein [Rariglobus hedericola]TSJ78574.1 hypothetical protein FPL22_04540 [Rariglobus hedericola]
MFSLVTTCMNRESHLRQSLPHWLALPGLAEVVIVDWSTHESIADLVDLDPRIRICRVEGEAKWRQPYPTNFGISQTTQEIILKCDADCIPSSRIGQYIPTADTFYAGNWRSGRPLGKACVNGQCLFTRTAFEKVNGYSELFRVYARDDEDLYERLSSAGIARRDINPADLNFIEHTQEARVANQGLPTTEADPIEAFLHRQTTFHEMTNVVISHYLPWGPWFPRAVYNPISTQDRFASFKRDISREIPLSAPLLQQAHSHALVAVVTQLFSLSPADAARLDRTRCNQLIRQHLAKKTAPQAQAAV